MAARPLPPPGPEPSSKKIPPTKTANASIIQSFLATIQSFLAKIRSIATGPALRTQLNALMKMRWLRIAGIVVAVLLVILIALPFLINVNSFEDRVGADECPGAAREVGRAQPFAPGRRRWRRECQHRRRSGLQQVAVRNSEVVEGGRRVDATHLLEDVERDGDCAGRA